MVDQKQRYSAHVEILAQDREGLMRDVSAVIPNEQVNMSTINVSTQHDIAPTGIDGPLKVGSRTKSTLTHYEENVDFPESEFRYTFPKGTRVQDHILDIDYTVKEDHFGRISNAPYLVADR